MSRMSGPDRAVAAVDPAPQHLPKDRSKVLDPQSQRRLNARINRLLREADQAEAAALDDVRRQLDELQDEVRILIAAEGGQTGYAQLLGELDRRITGRVQQISRRISGAIAEAAEHGIALVDDAVAVATGRTVAGVPPEGIVRRVQLRAATLMRAAREQLVMAVTHQVLMLDSGDADLTATLNAVGRQVVGSRVFGAPAMRIRQVVTTEPGHAHGAAMNARMMTPPGGVVVRKRWIWSHDPTGGRATHAEAERRYAPGGSVGPIWPEQKFTVGGYSTPYPRGPGLPGVEKLNCGCRSIPVVETVEGSD